MSFHTFLGNLPGYLLVALVFLLMISILVFAHEMGHYLFARLFNMGVEEFAVGFGKNPIFTYARRTYLIPVQRTEIVDFVSVAEPRNGVEAVLNRLEGGDEARPAEYVNTPTGMALKETTNFTIRPIPAGGFVRIKGMLPEEDGSEIKIPGGFYSKAPWKRLIVLFAGPAFSVLAGILILVPVLMIDGIPKNDPRPIIGEVAIGFAADKAGLKPGDKILTLQGKPVARFYDVVKVVTHSPGVPLAMTYERAGKQYSTTVVPEMEAEPSPIIDENLDLDFTGPYKRQAKMGTSPMHMTVHPGFNAALAEAVKAPIDTVVGIAKIFMQPSTFSHSVSGPVAMVSVTNMAVQEGVLEVLKLMAVLSISVGIFNLLPFPPLDGGQMAIALAEMFRGGRRLSIQIQGFVSTAGLLAVVVLMVSALYVDFKQLTKSSKPPAFQPSVAKPSPAKPK